MAERKATNKYYPPSWDPSKGSINRFVGQHPLRARAAKSSMGIIVVRFEMPFNIWCLSCQKHIGQGTRYNAEKKKIGHYYSSPIYAFTMTCHLCSGKIEIHTDPKLGEYVIKEGARKRVEEFSAKDAETIELIDDKTREKMESDPFYKLEHGIQLKEKMEEKGEVLEKIIAINEEQWADPWTVSQRLRKSFREEKKRRIDLESKETEYLDKNALSITLLPEFENDKKVARSISFGKESSDSGDFKTRIMAESIFPNSSKQSPSSLENVINRHRVSIDPFARKVVVQEDGNSEKNIKVGQSTLDLLAYYSSDDND